MYILTINSGSSSLRFKVFKGKSKCIYQGHIDGISQKKCKYIEKTQKHKKEYSIKCSNHNQAIQIALQYLLNSKIISDINDIKAIGHRVVHGGEKYYKPTLINKKVVKEIEKLSNLAPLHNPANLEGIKAALNTFKSSKSIAVFDTAFHHNLEAKNFLYGFPLEFYKKYGIRRYGFHGSSHKYVSKEAIKHLKKQKFKCSKIISCHLGNGCSITAIKNGKSIDTSMGFTPLEGVMMGTRTGDFDPGIPSFLKENHQIDSSELNEIANKKSGLLGISGKSSDIRVLRDLHFDKKNPKAKLALDLYCYRIAKYISSYLSTLGGLDALIFTAGIGENAWYIRKWICDHFKFLNLQLSHSKNRNNELEINTNKSDVKVLVIPTDEELQITQEIYPLIK